MTSICLQPLTSIICRTLRTESPACGNFFFQMQILEFLCNHNMSNCGSNDARDSCDLQWFSAFNNSSRVSISYPRARPVSLMPLLAKVGKSSPQALPLLLERQMKRNEERGWSDSVSDNYHSRHIGWINCKWRNKNTYLNAPIPVTTPYFTQYDCK